MIWIIIGITEIFMVKDKLFDEASHLSFLNNAVMIGIKLSEEHVELLHGRRSQTLSSQHLIQEIGRLNLIKDTWVVNIVLVPNTKDLFLDEIFFLSWQLLDFSSIFFFGNFGLLDLILLIGHLGGARDPTWLL